MLQGHERDVCGVYVLSDKRLVLSMEVAQKVHLWRAEDGLTLRLYAGPTAIHSISPNSQFCISGAGDQRFLRLCYKIDNQLSFIR